MRSGIVAAWSALLVVGAFAVSSSTALAAPSASNLTASDEMTIEGEAATLRQAYVYIEAANAYHGHRNKALKEVGAACRSLGGPAKGVARHHEDPQFSDSLFTKARGLLLNVLSHAQAKGQSGVISHVETAIQEIETALSGEEEPHHKGKSPGSTSSK
jgi:hypothetical protein